MVTTWVVCVCGCTSKYSESSMVTLKDNLNSENECIQPYMFEPSRENEPQGLSGSGTHQRIPPHSSDDESFDEEFEAANAWRRSSLQWCKCGKCSIISKTIESFLLP